MLHTFVLVRGCIGKMHAIHVGLLGEQLQKGYHKFMCNTHKYLIYLIYNRKSNAKNAREREIIHFYFNFMSDNIAGILGTWQIRKSEEKRISISINVNNLGILH